VHAFRGAGSDVSSIMLAAHAANKLSFVAPPLPDLVAMAPPHGLAKERAEVGAAGRPSPAACRVACSTGCPAAAARRPICGRACPSVARHACYPASRCCAHCHGHCRGSSCTPAASIVIVCAWTHPCTSDTAFARGHACPAGAELLRVLAPRPCLPDHPDGGAGAGRRRLPGLPARAPAGAAGGHAVRRGGN
jgi:hypothetical protein